MTQEQWLQSRPALTQENELALEVWRFCAGWNPQAVPLAAAFYGVEDLAGLIDRLLVIRDRIDAHKAAQQAAHGRR